MSLSNINNTEADGNNDIASSSSSSQRLYQKTDLSSTVPFRSPPGFVEDFSFSAAWKFVSYNSQYFPRYQMSIFSIAISWVQHDVVNRKKYLLSFLKAVNLNTLLQENPRLSQLEISAGVKLGDDAECMKLILHTMENVRVSGHKSRLNLRINDEPGNNNNSIRSSSSRKSVKRAAEEIDSDDPDDHKEPDVNPIVAKSELLQNVNDNDSIGFLFQHHSDTTSSCSSSNQMARSIDKNETESHQSVSPQQQQIKPNKKLRLVDIIFPESIYSPSNIENLNFMDKKISCIYHNKNDNSFVSFEQPNNLDRIITAELIPSTTKITTTINATSSVQRQPQTQFKIIYPVVVENQMDLYVYDFETREAPQKMYHIQNFREFSSIVVTASHVYDIRGRDPNFTFTNPDGDDTGTVDVFCTATNYKNLNTRRYKTLEEPRREFATCVFQNEIYAIGSCQNKEVSDGIINYVEKLRIKKCGKHGHGLHSPKWKPASDCLRTPRANFDASVFQNKIFAVGGIGEGEIPLDSVEIFDSSKWAKGGNLCQRRGYLKTAVCEGKLYAVGGAVDFDQVEVVLKYAEVYDPTDDSWSFIADMKCPRKNFGLIESNGLLFAIGGNTDSSIQSIEFYDPAIGELGQWCLMEWPSFLHQDADFRSAVLYP